MTTQTPTLVGTIVPIPRLGEQRLGLVVSESWSNCLGQILRVKETGSNSTSTVLVYGDALRDLHAALLLA